jgi:hypothetical protein
MSIQSGQAILPGHLYTYQDLAGVFGACAKTIARWFANRRKFRPTKNTVRILGSEVLKFIEEQMSPEMDGKKDGVRRKKCPGERD